MLKQLILENWKSFRHAVLDIDPLTVLIGTNASGKSNAIEALEFLRRITSGETIETALVGNSKFSGLRGGTDFAAFNLSSQFSFQVLIQGQDENTDYLYNLSIKISLKTQLITDSLTQIKREAKEEKKKQLYSAIRTPNDDFIVHVRMNNKSKAPFRMPSLNSSFLSLLNFVELPFDADVKEGLKTVLNSLKSVFVLDPIPSKMRSYSSLSHDLASDASNIAGVLAALPEGKKAEIEATLTQYLSHLPDRDIQKIWAETVGRLNSDAMLYCEETWVPGEPPLLIDARGMSDGTLRFLAILTALLTRPEGSQLIIEDVDNGLHPSRANLLLKMLREIGEKRNIDVLVTTHNPALLNALEPEYIPFVVVAHRDSQTGESKLTLLEDIDNLPKLLASGSLGTIATQGLIEKSLTHQEQQA